MYKIYGKKYADYKCTAFTVPPSPRSRNSTLPASQKPFSCPFLITTSSFLSKVTTYPNFSNHRLLLYVRLYHCNHLYVSFVSDFFCSTSLWKSSLLLHVVVVGSFSCKIPLCKYNTIIFLYIHCWWNQFGAFTNNNAMNILMQIFGIYIHTHIFLSCV